MKKIQIVFNPVSGGGRHQYLDRVIRAIRSEAAARSEQVEVDVYHTTEAGDATRFLREEELDADMIIAAGGDGTTNEVVNGLEGNGIPLGIIPAGTTNVLAYELGMPKKPAALAKKFLNENYTQVFPARLNGKRFIMMAGVGYDAWVVNRVSMEVKEKLGKAAYVLSMLQQFVPYGRKEYKVTMNGQTWSVPSLVATNGRKYAGNFNMSQKACISDPTIQVLMFKSPSRWMLLAYLLGLPLGLMEAMSTSVATTRLEVTCDEACVLQADGDPAGSLPAVIEVEQEPLLFIS